MFTVVVAWLAVAAVCLAAVLFGQGARAAPRRRRRSPAGRLGLFLSLSGPWLAVLVALACGLVSGAWLRAAAVGVCAVVLVALVGLALRPH